MPDVKKFMANGQTLNVKDETARQMITEGLAGRPTTTQMNFVIGENVANKVEFEKVNSLPAADIKCYPTVYATYSGSDNAYTLNEYDPESENADENGWIQYGGAGGGGASGCTVLDVTTSDSEFIGKEVVASADEKNYSGVINALGKCRINANESGIINVSLTVDGNTYGTVVSAPYFGNYNVLLEKGELVTVELMVDDFASFQTAAVTLVDETAETEQTVQMGATRHMFAVPAGHDYHIEYGEVEFYTSPVRTDTRTAEEGSHMEYRGTYTYSVEIVSVTLTANDSLDVSSLSVTMFNTTEKTSETKQCVNGHTTFMVTKNQNYYVSAETVNLHTKPETESIKAVAGNARNITLQYIASTALDACDWATIKSYIQAGTYASVWEVGDTKRFALKTGEEVEIAIAAFNHDTKQAGGKAPITFAFTHSLANPGKMNDTNTNSGGWRDSYMRNTIMTNVLNTLPDELKSMVVPVVKSADIGYNTAITNTNDSMWLFAEEEIFGAATYGKSGMGTQYPYFATTAKRIATMGLNGGAGYWWERGSYSANASNFCSVNPAGTPGNSGASDAYGVRPGFCIG